MNAPTANVCSLWDIRRANGELPRSTEQEIREGMRALWLEILDNEECENRVIALHRILSDELTKRQRCRRA